VPGIARVQADQQGYLARARLDRQAMVQATHLVWATGGNMVPSDEMEAYLAKGRELLAKG
jgi:D-serine dehydratase